MSVNCGLPFSGREEEKKMEEYATECFTYLSGSSWPAAAALRLQARQRVKSRERRRLHGDCIPDSSPSCGVCLSFYALYICTYMLYIYIDYIAACVKEVRFSIQHAAPRRVLQYRPGLTRANESYIGMHHLYTL